MKRMLCSIAAAVAMFTMLPATGWATELLVPVGRLVGLQLRDGSVTVAAYDDALGAAAREAGLKIGDEILTVAGQSVHSAGDISKVLETAGDRVTLTVRRGGKTVKLSLTPQETAHGPRLGIYLRQGIAGIGTVTWYDPESGSFGTLGHGVSGSGGALLAMTGGTAYPAEVVSVKKGKSGEPGQLKGSCDALTEWGKLEKNTPQGVFGTSRMGWEGEAIPVAEYDEIRTGPATVRSTVRGDRPQDYSVEILKIYPQDREDCRNFLIKVTDPALLELTGGIVQGMSGSPILQNGKLVGAVTHVLVNDPTRGYGIFIENMLEAAE